MSDTKDEAPAAYGDPITRPFWDAARRRELLIQHCVACGAHQFYPRRFCLACGAAEPTWAPASGLGTIYSATTVRLRVVPELEPPYVVAVVELDEGPRLLTNIEGGEARIGDRVRVAWRERGAEPPLPVFRPLEG